MLTIKILGSGCENCKRLAWLSQHVLDHLSIDAEVIKVTDYPEIMKYGVLSTPGLVINEKLVCSGRVPSEAEITTFITSALTQMETV